MEPKPSILLFFQYAHLPGPLQDVSIPFSDVAHWMVGNLPDNEERAAGLRKLLEAKDCAVRARVQQMSATKGSEEG